MRTLHEKLTCDECGETAEWMYDPPTDRSALRHWITGANGHLDFCSAKCAEIHFSQWDNDASNDKISGGSHGKEAHEER